MRRASVSLASWLSCAMVVSLAAGCRREPVVNDQAVVAAIKQALGVEAREVRAFYRARGFSPAWTSDATARASVDQLIAAIRDAEAEGLHASDYRVAQLEAAIHALGARPKNDVVARARLAG